MRSSRKLGLCVPVPALATPAHHLSLCFLSASTSHLLSTPSLRSQTKLVLSHIAPDAKLTVLHAEDVLQKKKAA